MPKKVNENEDDDFKKPLRTRNRKQQCESSFVVNEACLGDGKENESGKTTRSSRSKKTKTDNTEGSEQKTKSPTKKSAKKKKPTQNIKTLMLKKTPARIKTPKTNDSIGSNASILDLACDNDVKLPVEKEERSPIRFNTSRPKRKKRKSIEMPSSAKTKRTKSMDAKKTKSQSTLFREESPLKADFSIRSEESKTKKTINTKSKPSESSSKNFDEESPLDYKKKPKTNTKTARSKSPLTPKKSKKTKSKSPQSTKSTDSDTEYALGSPTISVEELMESKERDQEIRKMEDISSLVEPSDTIDLEDYGKVSLEDMK